MDRDSPPHVVVIGGGPAGLFAAETASAAGARVSLYEAKASVGRKLLVAGRGGLNLTHGEVPERFVSRYDGNGMPETWWRNCLTDFTPEMLRAWAKGLGIETFQQRTGRVYPREMKAAPLLRRWVERLRAQKVTLFVKHRWVGWGEGTSPELRFSSPDGEVRVVADAVILALGGASWSITGSDGRWVGIMQDAAVKVSPWQPANCGWEVAWPEKLIPEIEGQPMKNLAAAAGEKRVVGELMLTRYGLDGGILYQLGPALRAMPVPEIVLDAKPDFSEAVLLRKIESVKKNFLSEAVTRWRLPPSTHALLRWAAERDGCERAEDFVRLVKCLRLPLLRARPIEEAISSAGGVAWSELNDDLSLRKIPSVFMAGEMIDWEAPTGGYLMQGCFAMGRLAAMGALAFCDKARRMPL